MVSQWAQMVKSSGLGLQALRLVGASGTPAHLNLEQFEQCIFFAILTKIIVCTYVDHVGGKRLGGCNMCSYSKMQMDLYKQTI